MIIDDSIGERNENFHLVGAKHINNTKWSAG